MCKIAEAEDGVGSDQQYPPDTISFPFTASQYPQRVPNQEKEGIIEMLGFFF